MSELHNHTDVKMGSDKSFGLVFAAVFAIIGLFPLLGDGGVRLWAMAISAGFALVALIRPVWLHRLNKLWFAFGMLLGRVVSPIAMGLIFLLSVTPIGLLMRAFGKDPLNKSFDETANSYWIPVDAEKSAASSMKNQF